MAADQTEIGLDLAAGRFSTGIYLLSLRSEELSITRRLVIAR